MAHGNEPSMSIVGDKEILGKGLRSRTRQEFCRRIIKRAKELREIFLRDNLWTSLLNEDDYVGSGSAIIQYAGADVILLGSRSNGVNGHSAEIPYSAR